MHKLIIVRHDGSKIEFFARLLDLKEPRWVQYSARRNTTPRKIPGWAVLDLDADLDIDLDEIQSIYWRGYVVEGQKARLVWHLDRNALNLPL